MQNNQTQPWIDTRLQPICQWPQATLKKISRDGDSRSHWAFWESLGYTSIPGEEMDGSSCFCMDYWHLNTVTGKDFHLLPLIDNTLDHVTVSKWFSSGVATGQLNEPQMFRPKTTGTMLWHFLVIPLILCNKIQETNRATLNSTGFWILPTTVGL